VLIFYRLLAIAALSLCISGYAHSQQTPQAKKPAQHSQKPQIGSEEKPLAVDVVRTRKTPDEAHQDQVDRETKVAADKRLGDLTEDLAKSTKDLARATDTLIVVGLIQFGVFVLQLIAFGYQAHYMRKTLRALEEDHISTHRPKLVLRDAVTMPVIGEQIDVIYTIVNTGGSRARITESALHLDFVGLTGPLTGGPRVIPPSEGSNDVGALPLVAGQHITTEFTSDRTTRWPVPERLELIFSGHIVYVDDSGIARHTGFYRAYDPFAARFYKSDKREWKPLDYED